MESVLRNMANRLVLDFCIENNIDRGSQGSYITKKGRGFTYALCTSDTGAEIATITFHKSQVPTFTCDFRRRMK